MTPAEAAEAMGETVLAPGVHGHLFDTPEGLYVPIITADEPGTGDVARFLDSLPRDKRVVFPSVWSLRLREMLLRRGFRDAVEDDPRYGRVQLMERKAR